MKGVLTIMNTEVIAMYLPQYHSIPENDKWWGHGYTDWKAVKNAKPLFSGHEQPRIPQNGDYYDLSQKNVIKKQAELAKKYGVYGWGIYHYWFSSEQILLDTPPNIIKDSKDIDINYFFMWDNGSWKRTWSNVKFSNSWAPLYEGEKKGPEILAELKYGDKSEWKKHFEYLLPFFRDNRYIKIDGKPLFGIFNQNNGDKTLKKMFDYWNQCAEEVGFPGIAIIGKSNASHITVADYQFDYEPATHAWVGKNNIQKAMWRIKDNLRIKFGKLKIYDYSAIWRRILRDISKDDKYFAGAFVKFDDTPRRGKKSSIVINDTPEKFEDNLKRLLSICKKYGKAYIFLTAWNEWGEGSYLEPDEQYGCAYLESLKRAIDSVRD